MGNFYTNISLKGPTQDEVVDYLRQRRRRAFVAPRQHGVTVVFDEESDEQDVEVLADLTRDLSSQFKCHALAALVHDDDDLLLLLYDRGESRLQYESRTGPRAGASILTAAFQTGATPLLWIVMQLPYVVFESMRHSWIARILRLPRSVVSTGYRYIEHDELPEGLRREDLVNTMKPGED